MASLPGVVEGRKSPAQKAGLLRAVIPEPLAAAQQAAAFDTYPDFAKINAKCYKSTRANTFNTPGPLLPGAGAIPTTPGRPESRQVPSGPIRDLLEIFEMGVARNMISLRNEVREELQTSTESLRKEVLAALADTRGLVMLREIIQKVDVLQQGPVNVDFAPVLSELKCNELQQRDAAQGMERQVAQGMSTLFDELRLAQRRQQERAERAEAQHQAVQAALAEAARAAGERFGELRGAQRSISTALQQASDEASRVQEESKQHQDRVVHAHGQGAERGEELAEMVRAVQGQLERLAALQRSLDARGAEAAEELRSLRQEGAEYRAGLAPSVGAELARRLQAQTVKVDFSQVLGHIRKTQLTLSHEFPQLLAEIGRIQQALNVDFVNFLDLHYERLQANAVQDDHMGPRLGEIDDATEPAPESPATPPGEPLALQLVLPRSSTSGSRPFSTSRTGELRGTGVLAKTASLFMRRRVRHYWTQTEAPESVHGWAQTDEVFEKPCDKKKAKKRASVQHMKQHPLDAGETRHKRPAKTNHPVFADSEAMKQRARQALIRPQYHVFDHYHSRGLAQAIAKSWIFDNVTLLVIVLNSIWLAIDADNNKAIVLVDADPIFQVVENLFCLFFAFEVLLRFCAFRAKRDCLRDGWFIFDSTLALLMIIETWVITIIVFAAGVRNAASIGGFSVLRTGRMVKMVRISRMARLLRSLPELVVVLKGVKAASRSVMIFFLLWLIIIYVYALVFRMLADDHSQHFQSVPEAMNSLLLDGVLPDHAAWVNSVASENPLFWPVTVSFIALASVTLMNMLVGVLVEVVSAIASIEKESIAVVSLASDLRDAMTSIGRDPEEPISKQDFPNLIVDPEIARVVQREGVDVVSLVDMTESIYEERLDEDGDVRVVRLSFADFVEVVLNMRGTNPAKVKDVKQQLRFVKALVKESSSSLLEAVTEEMGQVRCEVERLREVMLAIREAEVYSSDDNASDQG